MYLQLKMNKFQVMEQSQRTSIVYQVAILMENDTQGILFNVKRDDFEFPYHTKIFLSTFIVVILISQYVFQRRCEIFAFFSPLVPSKREKNILVLLS